MMILNDISHCTRLLLCNYRLLKYPNVASDIAECPSL